jgi:DNA-binding protein Fis
MDTARLDVLRGVTRHMATADNMETVLGASGAAELLGINPSTLRSRMQKLGISLKTVPS